MNNQTARDLKATAISDADVVEYLQRHSDFFERHAALLSKLRLPHGRGASTVSLVERQVQVLREKNELLEGKVREFIEVARTNDALTQKIHDLAKRLVAARGIGQLLDALETSLRDDFGATEWLLVLTRKDVPQLARIESRHLRLAAREQGDLKAFETFFDFGRPRCGQIRDSQRDYLFGAGTIEIGSAALLPLGPQDDTTNGSTRADYGLLAIGSPDADRFHPTMSTDYLVHIGQLVSAAVGQL